MLVFYHIAAYPGMIACGNDGRLFDEIFRFGLFSGDWCQQTDEDTDRRRNDQDFDQRKGATAGLGKRQTFDQEADAKFW